MVHEMMHGIRIAHRSKGNLKNGRENRADWDGIREPHVPFLLPRVAKENKTWENTARLNIMYLNSEGKDDIDLLQTKEMRK